MGQIIQPSQSHRTKKALKIKITSNLDQALNDTDLKSEDERKALLA